MIPTHGPPHDGPRLELDRLTDRTEARLTTGGFPLAVDTSGGNHAKVVTIADNAVITVQSTGNTWRNDNFTADHFSHDIAQLKSKIKMAEQSLRQLRSLCVPTSHPTSQISP